MSRSTPQEITSIDNKTLIIPRASKSKSFITDIDGNILVIKLIDVQAPFGISTKFGKPSMMINLTDDYASAFESLQDELSSVHVGLNPFVRDKGGKFVKSITVKISDDTVDFLDKDGEECGDEEFYGNCKVSILVNMSLCEMMGKKYCSFNLLAAKKSAPVKLGKNCGL